MIVDPDFLDHWRTRMLVDALGGDEMAPFYVLRIWGHCQQRHGDRFAMPAAGVKALCKATCGAADLEQALIDAGFIAREGSEIVVLKWAEKNASLLAAWENGNKGGRPKKKTQEKPSENPAVTETKPTANPDETQTKPIREEKRREEESSSLRSEEARKRAATPECPEDVSKQTWADWLQLRRQKKAPVTETVLQGARSEAEKAQMPLERFLAVWCMRGTQGLQADWLKPHERGSPSEPSKSGKHSGFDRKNYREGVTEDGSLV